MWILPAWHAFPTNRAGSSEPQEAKDSRDIIPTLEGLSYGLYREAREFGHCSNQFHVSKCRRSA